jgi:hypothetical protein
MRTYETEKRIASEIENSINCFCTEKEVAKNLCKMHRTLQQTFMRIACYFIKEQAQKTSYDLRNEATVKLSKQIMEKIPYEDMYVPMI